MWVLTGEVKSLGKIPEWYYPGYKWPVISGSGQLLGIHVTKVPAVSAQISPQLIRNRLIFYAIVM